METKLEKTVMRIKIICAMLFSFLSYIENITAAISMAIIEFTESEKLVKYLDPNQNIADNPPIHLSMKLDIYLLHSNLYVFYMKSMFEVPDSQIPAINTIFNGESGSRDKMYKTPNKPQVNRNLGLIERIIRFMTSIVLTIYFIDGINIELLSLSVLITTLTLFPTAIFGFCPFYYLLGFNSCRKNNNRVSTG